MLIIERGMKIQDDEQLILKRKTKNQLQIMYKMNTKKKKQNKCILCIILMVGIEQCLIVR